MDQSVRTDSHVIGALADRPGRTVGRTCDRQLSPTGISSHLNVLSNPEKQDGNTIGDIERWTIIAGRLRSVETIARGVPIEGFLESPSSAGAAMS